MRKQFFIGGGLVLLFLISFSFMGNSQGINEPKDNEDINQLVTAITKNPDNLELHEKYLKASGFTKWGAEEDPVFIENYKKWMKQYPESATIAYALGHAYAGKESPKAKPYLLKAVEIDPKFHKAYFDLWIDEERWGDFKVSRAYLAKAKESDPTNADYAFYYANGFDDSDFPLYTKLSLEVAKNFPKTERGAQALYWLAAKTKDTDLKIKYYEQQRKDFPAGKFNWSNSGMSSYFDVLLEKSVEDALKLATYMSDLPLDERSVKTWQGNEKLAKNVMEVQSLIKNNKATEAGVILDSSIHILNLNKYFVRLRHHSK